MMRGAKSAPPAALILPRVGGRIKGGGGGNLCITHHLSRYFPSSKNHKSYYAQDTSHGD